MRTTCKNCGASLIYNETQYGKKAKCQYCRTEYNIDLLGRVEEYKVKLEIMGAVREFYISDLTVHQLFNNSYRDIEGRLKYKKPKAKIKLNLIEF